LAIDLITKRHECSYLFYLIDIAILFVGIPQAQSSCYFLPSTLTHLRSDGVFYRTQDIKKQTFFDKIKIFFHSVEDFNF